MSTAAQEIRLQYGMAKKSYFEMNEMERKEVARLALEKAKFDAFSRGLPIIFSIDGLIIAEYANGERFIRENGKDIIPYDGK